MARKSEIRTRGALAFLSSEKAAVSIDFLLWVPILFAIVILATDATIAFMRQSHLWQVSRETARIVSRYGMDESTAEAFAQSEATIGSTSPIVDVSIGTTDVSVSISMPVNAMLPFGTLGFALDDNITTRVTHALEPR